MRLIALSALAAAGLAAAPALAQPPAGAPPGEGRRMVMRTEIRTEMREHMEAAKKQHAADLATVLRLRPDQQPALTAWLDAMRPPESMAPPTPPAAGAAPPTAIQELDRAKTRMAEHEAKMRDHEAALRRFYAALNPEQQAVFDAMHRLQRGGHQGMGHGPKVRVMMRHMEGGPGEHGGPGMEGPPPPPRS